MKKTKKTIAILSAAAMLACGTPAAMANEDNSVTLPAIGLDVQTEAPETDHGYLVGTMTVGENGETIASETGGTHLYKADGAFILNDKGEALTYDDVKAGDKITYYVDGNAPMTLQLPVHYIPAVIVVATENSNVSQLISVFDEDGLSDDGDLMIHYDLSTPYFSRTREAAFISGKALILYDMVAESIPAQTNPIAIVKLVDDPDGTIPQFGGHGPQLPETGAAEPAYVTGSFEVGENGETLTNRYDETHVETHICKNESTLILNKQGEQKTFDDIKAGDRIIYYVNADQPMTLQYPVHYTAEVIVIDDGSSAAVKLANFNSELLTFNRDLQIHVSEDTKLYGADSFEGGTALVIYNFATMSIPPQTTPLALVVMENQPESPKPADIFPDLSGVNKVVIGDKTIDYIPVTVNGVQMLPVREVAEALGYDVDWLNETRSVNVGHASFSLDEDSYAFAKMAPQSLGQAPVLISLPGAESALTYVPAVFFTAIMNCQAASDGETLMIAPEGADISTMPMFQKMFEVPKE